MHQMRQAVDGAQRPEQHDAEQDVGHLADRGVGQPLFQIVLKQRRQETQTMVFAATIANGSSRSSDSANSTP